MRADKRVLEVSLDKALGVPIYEWDGNQDIMVLFVPLRTDYDEQFEEAIARADRIAKALTVRRSKDQLTQKGDTEDGNTYQKSASNRG
jgi:hypothetical protein